MSAYLVEDRTINRVICYLNLHVQRDHYWLFEQFLKAADLSPADPEWKTKLGLSMAILNESSLDERYGKGTGAGDRGAHYEYKCEIGTAMQAVKSLQCWKYQCSEGNIPETSPLFQWAEKLELYILNQIVSNLPEYDRAEWA